MNQMEDQQKHVMEVEFQPKVQDEVNWKGFF